MKNSILTFLATIATLVLFSSCEKNNEKPEPNPKTIELTAKSAEVIATANNFGIDLFVKTAQEEDKNFMLSPLSASIALTMALNGADGETFNQMKEMLGYPADSNLDEINNAYQSLVDQLLVADNKATLSLANALFYRQGFEIKPPYISTLETLFDAEVEGLDFDNPSTLTTINQWAADQTNQKITKVIDRIDPLTMMFLMNALYFKGDWTHQFDKSKTTDLPFILPDGNTKDVGTMIGEVGANITWGTNYSTIELPYGRKNFSMVVVLPEGSLSDFYTDFTPDTWQEITTSLDSQNDWNDIHVTMPKFKFEYEKILNDVLKAMGMIDAFDYNLADFSDISVIGHFKTTAV